MMISKNLTELILHLEKFEVNGVESLIKDLRRIDKISSVKERTKIKDKVEGLMHAEGAGALLIDGKSLPQVAQQILIEINPRYLI